MPTVAEHSCRTRGPRRIWVTPVLAVTLCCHTAWPTQRNPADSGTTCEIRVDPRVELLSIIFRLAGNPEYSRGRVEQYTADVEKHFGPHRDHAVVRLASRLRETRGVSFDAVMGLAVHLQDAVELKEAVPLDPPCASLDQRWHPAEAREFITAARDFVQQTDFPGFIAAHQPLYQTTEQRLREVLEQNAHLEWFGEFFGGPPRGEFTVAIGMLNGGSCYGPHVRLADGREELYCVLGVWSTDAQGLPQFDDSMLSTVIHEFCHSYANAIVDRHEAELKPAGEKIYPYVRAAMERQAYGNWKTMMYESLVRACTIRYAHKHQGTVAATKQMLADQQRQFLWIRDLARLLAKYEQQRDQYPTLDQFAPSIVLFFDQYAAALVAKRGEQGPQAPQIVSLDPANGAIGIDPSLMTIRVVFDRPMKDQSWSLVGGGPHFPELVGKPRYDSRHTTWTVEVKLKPEWSYEFWLNSDRFTAFQSQEGVPLAPLKVTFQTGPQR